MRGVRIHCSPSEPVCDAVAAGDAADDDNASEGDEAGVEMTVEQFRALMKQRADDAPHLAAIDALVRRRVTAPGALPVAREGVAKLVHEEKLSLSISAQHMNESGFRT